MATRDQDPDHAAQRPGPPGGDGHRQQPGAEDRETGGEAEHPDGDGAPLAVRHRDDQDDADGTGTETQRVDLA
ncbi:hypothetical protein V2I01_43315 [Micromonospora sp. BRA006-A]|nr:hypothetical protein [Micromonospora sp. BRA006-A]